MTERSWWCEYAVLPTGVTAGVLIRADDDVITSVEPHAEAAQAATTLAGLVIPGLANCHSHAFHRALRARTQRERGSFWTWREQMYAVAERLTPDTYFALARAIYAEMALAGITNVGEFHYLHHDRGGHAYADANVMGEALVAAAGDAGLRITLLDTCYLTGGVDEPLSGVQLRFGDGDADAWVRRVDELAETVAARTDVLVGAAVHSVRGVPADQIPAVAHWAADRDVPLHAHLSEQRAENDACLARYGRTPTGVLAEAGALGARTSVVHATHLTDDDIALLGGSATYACFCPTTERDLADGIGPARRLVEAGAPLTLGSDSHAVVDLLEEARAVELDQRLASQARGHFTAAELLSAATETGHASLGRPDAGVLAVGRRADLVALDLGSVRTAGFDPNTGVETAVFAATAADVVHVVSGGRTIVEAGVHTHLPDTATALTRAIGALQ